MPACSSSGTVHPTITELRSGTRATRPLLVCTGVAGLPGARNSDTPSFTLIGSGFVPNVNLVSDHPSASFGTARFVGPTTIDTSVSGNSQEVGVGVKPTKFVIGEPLVPPGAYDFVFVDSDGGEFHLPHAVDFVLPPQVSGTQPSSICPDRNETVTVLGSGFTPGPTSVAIAPSFSPLGPGFPATATADSVIVTIPAGSLFPNSSSPPLVVNDVSGCTSPVFTVNVTPACGP